MARIGRWGAAMVGGIGLLGVAVALASAAPPEGRPGAEAEALAARIETAVAADAWARTGAVRWTIFGHRYLWDRVRNLVRYEDGKGVVLTEGWRPMGRAFRGGAEVGGAWKDRRVADAYEWFLNDAFWAFAFTKLHDAGAERSAVDGRLLVRYPSGGVTPGDAYLWELGPDGLPAAWRIWASVLPVKGARIRWEDWVTLPTGIRVPTTRRAGPFAIHLEDLDATAHLSDWGPDPFAPMLVPPPASAR